MFQTKSFKKINSATPSVSARIYLLLFTIFFNHITLSAQNVGINTTTPDASAALEVAATNKGMLVPRMTTVQRTAIASPATGLLVFDTTLGQFYFYMGAAWTGIPLSIAASNGLATESNSVKLGGTLSEKTNIRATNYNLDITGTANTESVMVGSALTTSFSNNQSAYQTFTSGSSYTSDEHITSVSIRYKDGALTSPTAQLSIYQGADTTGILLGTKAITLSGSFGKYTLSAPIPLKANTQYTMAIKLNSAPNAEWLGYNLNDPISESKSSLGETIDLGFAIWATPYNSVLLVDGINDKVGIGTRTPTEKLDINGKTKTTNFQMTNGAANGYFLKSDANGNASWVNPTSLSNGNWTTSNTDQFSALSGNVGIGTTTPTKGKVEINGSASNTLRYGYLNSSGTTGLITNGTANYSLYASDRIAASEFNAFSDLRIKKILRGSNSREDLATLMQLKITDYKLIDSIAKGNTIYKKVIAQEVAEVYPNAVSKITDVIPNIYKIATIEKGFIHLKNHNLQVGDKVKLIFGESQNLYKVLKINEKGFYTEGVSDGSVFVYGKEVNDFHTVDYEALTTLNISATQELVKQINDLKAQNTALKADNSSMKGDIEALKAAVFKKVD
jgi:hypothetical protein